MNVNSYIKNYNLIFVARNSGNILVKSISFYLERFQGYGVLKNVQLFGWTNALNFCSTTIMVRWVCTHPPISKT